MVHFFIFDDIITFINNKQKEAPRCFVWVTPLFQI